MEKNEKQSGGVAKNRTKKKGICRNLAKGRKRSCADI